MKHFMRILVLFALCLTFTGCSQEPVTTFGDSTTAPSPVTPVDTADLFSDRDFDYSYQNPSAITLQGETASTDSANVKVEGSTVTVTGEGVYALSGTLKGMVLVSCPKDEKVQLVLSGVSIENPTGAAIYVLQADKVFITLADGTQNALSNSGTFTPMDGNNIDAALFSKEDLTLNGSGKLTVLSPAGHGIVSKDDLRITGGDYTITVSGHGMTGKDAVKIAGGAFLMTTGKDGIHAENDEDTSLGYVYISDGIFDLTSALDGISAGGFMQLDGGSYTILSGGGSQYGEDHPDDFGGMGGRPGMGSSGSSTTSTESKKGLKAAGSMLISGGTFHLNAADDAVHSNGHLSVSGGSFTIATGDDGFHADESLSISAGTIRISESYEGLEGLSITVSGGDINLKASDDGLNAAGGNDQSGFQGKPGRPGMGGDHFGSSSDSYIVISGGNLFVDADSDGIDSNGNLTVFGGYTVVEGPTSGGNGPLDYGGSGSISGGTVLITGSSQMAQNLASTGTQGVLGISFGGNVSAGTAVTITDSKGKEVISASPAKKYACIVVSCPEMVKGQTYTITINGSSYDFEAQ